MEGRQGVVMSDIQRLEDRLAHDALHMSAGEQQRVQEQLHDAKFRCASFSALAQKH